MANDDFTSGVPGYRLPKPGVTFQPDPFMQEIPDVPEINAPEEPKPEEPAPDTGEAASGVPEPDVAPGKAVPDNVQQFFDAEDPVEYILRLDENRKRARAIKSLENDLGDLGLVPADYVGLQARGLQERLGFLGPNASEAAQQIVAPPKDRSEPGSFLVGPGAELTPEERKAEVQQDVVDKEQQLQDAITYRQQAFDNAEKELKSIQQMFGIPEEDIPPEMRGAYVQNKQLAIGRAVEDSKRTDAMFRAMAMTYQKELLRMVKALRDPSKWGPKYTRMTHYTSAFVQAAANMGFGISKGVIILGEMIDDPTLSSGKSDIRAAVDDVQKAFNEALPVDSYRAETQLFMTDLAQAGGSMSVFLFGGMLAQVITGSAKAGGWAAGLLGSMVESSALYEEAERYDATMWEKYFSYLAGLGIGATEALPISRMLGRMNIYTGGGIMRALAETNDGAVRSAIENGLQEFGQEFLHQLAAKASFDPTRSLDVVQQVREGIAGGTSGYLMQLFLGVGGVRRSMQAEEQGQRAAEQFLRDMQRQQAEVEFDGLQTQFDQETSFDAEDTTAQEPQVTVNYQTPTIDGEPATGRDGGGGDRGGALAPLEGAPTIEGATGPDRQLVDVAETIARDAGLPLRRQAEYAKVDEGRAKRIADAYDQMEHAPNDPKVREAYQALAEQTRTQYDALERAGYKFWLFDETNDPYDGNPWNAMRDLRGNRAMGVFATEAGFGSDESVDVADNPLLADTGLKWPYGSPDGPLKRVLVNDLFRAVHDALGHGIEGAGFRAEGEENAWQAHVRLFHGPAVAAMTTETRGQNSWLNFGPYGEQNRTAKTEETIFADQKTGLLPEWAWTEGRVGDAPVALTAEQERAIQDTVEGVSRARSTPLSDAEKAEMIETERKAAQDAADRGIDYLRPAIRLTGRDGLEYRVFTNPTPAQVHAIMDQPNRLPQLRYLQLKDHTVYAWDAHKAVHDDVMRSVGITYDEVLARGNLYRQGEIDRLLKDGQAPKEDVELADQWRQLNSEQGLVPDISFQRAPTDVRETMLPEELELPQRDEPLPFHDTPEPKYIRFGNLPKSGKSKIGKAPSPIHAMFGAGAGTEEAGISVFKVTYNAERNAWEIDLSLADSGIASLDELAFMQNEFDSEMSSGGHKRDSEGNYLGWTPPQWRLTRNENRRPIYLVTGEEVDLGVDGEPVLKDVQILDNVMVTDLLAPGYFDPRTDLQAQYNPDLFGLPDSYAYRYNALSNEWQNYQGDEYDSFSEFYKAKVEGLVPDISFQQAPEQLPLFPEIEPAPVDPDAFEKWFTGSKVVDDSGEPMIVYHGTGNGGFTIFETDPDSWKTRGTGAFFARDLGHAKTYSGTSREFVWWGVQDIASNIRNRYDLPPGFDTYEDADNGEFSIITPNDGDFYGKTMEEAIRNMVKEMGEYGTFQPEGDAGVYPVYLKLVDPFILDAKGANWSSIEWGGTQWDVYNEEGDLIETVFTEDEATDFEERGFSIEEAPSEVASTDQIVREIREMGTYDGVIIENVDDQGGYGWSGAGTVYVAFEPEQIKSATSNRGTYDPTDPDILHQTYKLKGEETSDALPMDHRRYFKFDERTTELPLRAIKPIRARPDGIANARVFMRRAYEGFGGGRQGLSVRDDGDGTYTLLDGNSTYAVAKESGWDTIPVRVLTDAEFAAEEKAKAAIPKEQKRTEAAKSFIPQKGVVTKWGVPEKYRPYTDNAFAEGQIDLDTDELLKRAPKARNELRTIIRDASAEAGVDGYIGPIKKRETIDDKVVRKGYPSAGHVKDVVRGTVVVDTPEQADAFVAKLGETHAVLDEYWKAYPGDYIDRKVSVKLTNGMLGEIIIIERELEAAKGKGHLFYDVARDTKAKEKYGQLITLQAQLKQTALYRTALQNAINKAQSWVEAYTGAGMLMPLSPSNQPSSVSGASQSNTGSGTSPNVASNVSGVSNLPLSQTSSQTGTSVQSVEPSLSTPARPSGMTMAGRPSISQNVGSDQGGVGTAAMGEDISRARTPGKRLKGELVGERTRPEGGIPDTGQRGSDVSIAKMSQNITRLLQLVVRQGRLASRGRDILGQYQRSTGVIRMRDMQDLSTRVHEAAHALHDAAAGPLNQFIKDHYDVISRIADEWYGGETPTVAMKSREGFAEFFRIYVLARGFGTQGADAIAGLEEANQAFDDMLASEAPQLKRGLDTLRQQFNTWLQIPDTQALKSMLVTAKRKGVIGRAIEEIVARSVDNSAGELARASGSWFDDKVATLYSRAIDSGTTLERVVNGLLNVSERNQGRAVDLKHADNPYVLYTLAKNAMGAVNVELKYGVRGYRSTQTVSRGLREGIMVAMGEARTSRGMAAFDQGRLDDFNAYLVARRALAEYERFEAGEIPFPPLGKEMSRGGLEQAIEDFESKYGDAFRDGAEIVYEYNQALWDKLHDAGMIDDDLWAKGKAKRDYVPLMRDMSDKGRAFGSETIMTTGKSKLIKAFQGSSRDIINPLDAIMNKTFIYERAIATNEVRVALAKLGDRAGTGAGRFVERIPANQMHAYNVNVLEVMKKALSGLDVDQVDAQDMYLTLEDAFNSTATVTMFRSTVTNEAGENIMFFYENGQRKAMQVADGEVGEDLMRVMSAIGKENMPMFFDTIAMTSNLFRAGITSWPDFLLVNYFRDQLQSWLQQEDFIPFLTGFKGVVDEIASRESAQSYNAMGGIMGGMLNASLHETRVLRDIRALEKRGYVGEVLGDVKAVVTGRDIRSIGTAAVKAMSRFTELTETGTRVGLFDKARKKYLADGLSEYEAGVAAAYMAVDNMNFGRSGSNTLALRRLIPFLNAQIQGLDKMWRTLSAAEGGRRRKGMSWKLLMGIAFKDVQGLNLNAQETKNLRIARKAWRKLIGLSLISMAIAAMQEDDPDYQQVSPYLKATGWVFMGDDGKYLWLPKPFEWAALGNMLEEAYKSRQGDGRAWERFREGLFYTVVPPTEIPILRTGYELKYNVDTFRKTPIVPIWMERFEAHEQYDAYTSELAKALGRYTNISPLKIDHFIKGIFTSAGRDLLSETNNAFNSNRPAMGLEDHFFTRRWIRDSKRGSNVVKDFYSYVSGFSGEMTKAYATYKKKVDDGRELDAADFLSKLTPDEQAYAILNTHFEAKDKRLHPMRRARDYYSVVGQMRREIISGDGLMSTEFKNDEEEIVMTARVKATVEDMLQEMAIRELRNALVLLGDRGYKNREYLPVDEPLALLYEYEPRVAEELERRLAKGKVYNWETVRDNWPELKTRLLTEGAEASLNDLLVGAAAP